LPILHALQGHPEAACLWEEHITGILATLGFTSTTHELDIYTAPLHNTSVILLCQVDNFALATSNPAIATEVYNTIGLLSNCPVKPLRP
jgi:hypothetical protein